MDAPIDERSLFGPEKARDGSVMDIYSGFRDIIASGDPVAMAFIWFCVIFIVLPVIGGCLIIAYSWVADPVKRPPRAKSWLPIFGTALAFLSV